MSHLALERNERTRTRTETQRGEVEQPHTQSFGHKSRANFKFGRLHKLQVWLDGYAGKRTRRRRKRRIPRILAWIASPRALDANASWHEGDMGQGTPDTPWTHRGLGAPLQDTCGQAEPERRHVSKTPHPTTRARLPRREDKSSGALEPTVTRLASLA